MGCHLIEQHRFVRVLCNQTPGSLHPAQQEGSWAWFVARPVDPSCVALPRPCLAASEAPLHASLLLELSPQLCQLDVLLQKSLLPGGFRSLDAHTWLCRLPCSNRTAHRGPRARHNNDTVAILSFETVNVQMLGWHGYLSGLRFSNKAFCNL